MRQTISGMVAAIALVAASAAPAMACGSGLFQGYVSPCAQNYVPAPSYSECSSGCGGWVHERLPDPVQQYYYADQGPTYTGPGDFAPYPTYQESAVSGWDAYRHHRYYYGYDGGRYANATHHGYDGAPNVEGAAIYSYRYGHHAHRHFRPWHAYGYPAHRNFRYGYAPHQGYYARHYSLPPRQYYAPHRSLRYGYGAPHHYGYREHVQHHYY